tara:strand:- start:536 stop:1030 length:495 start_codon:yes stop_codon:yes gene_type:complete
MGIKKVGVLHDESQKFPPDAEIIFREWAVNNTAITNICSTRIATRLPRNATLPFLTFFVAGGSLVSPKGDAAIGAVTIQVNAFAGRWGGGTSSQPDYATAYQLANGVAEAAFKSAKTIVHTTTTSTKGVIYGFDILEMPERIEETDTGLGHYQLSLSMYYRGLD